MSSCRFALLMFLLIVMLVLVSVLSLGVGAVFLPPGQVLNALLHPSDPGVKPTDVAIIRDLRLSRVLLAALIGAGLAAAGAAFQGLFRNPLADPYVVGASGGAALGASIAIVGGMTWRVAGLGPVSLAAFAGSLLAVFLVYFIAEVGGGSSAVTLLLAGASLSTLLTAITSLLMLVRDTTLHQVFAWTMGGLSGRSWPHLWNNGPYMLIGLGALWLLARPLDALAFGEETAESLGLPLSRARGALVAAASLTTAAAVATGGVIGFVGLVAPHAARLVFGATHHRLIPASALMGALLLLLADDLARTVLAPVELPVGIVTSLLGGTFFLYLLKTRQQELRGER